MRTPVRPSSSSSGPVPLSRSMPSPESVLCVMLPVVPARAAVPRPSVPPPSSAGRSLSVRPLSSPSFGAAAESAKSERLRMDEKNGRTLARVDRGRPPLRTDTQRTGKSFDAFVGPTGRRACGQMRERMQTAQGAMRKK